MKNQIGLDATYAKSVSEKLNLLLSNVQVFYQNVRGFHWNITGKQFYQLHSYFEDLYNDLNEKADEIAERILILGEQPVHAFSKYIKLSTIKEIENVSTFEGTVNEVLNTLKMLVEQEREILKFAGEADDDGTVDLMNGYISEQEKAIWMISAMLK